MNLNRKFSAFCANNPTFAGLVFSAMFLWILILAVRSI